MVALLAALNYSLVAVVFSCLLGSGVSQRARVALVWSAFPILGCFAVCRVFGIGGRFELVEQLQWYAGYHTHPVNQIIHLVFVPLLLATAFVFAAYVPPPFGPKHPRITWPIVAACAWSAHHVNASPGVGGLVSLLTFSMALGADAIVRRESLGGAKAGAKGVPSAKRYGRAARWAAVLHMLGWYMQIHPGHLVFEGRKPALLEGLVQSFMDAPLFVWYEAAFYLGYQPQLAQELHDGALRQHALWAAAAGA